MSKPGARALRVGVVLRGTLVEERVFDGARPITFGQSTRATLSVPVDGVPHERVLFALDRGRFVLHLDAAMDGRLGRPGAIASFDELRRGAREGEFWRVPLAGGARGKLRVGDATLLFQELAAPPAAPRPQLPASVRGTLADRVDGKLATIIGGSLVAHIGLALWASLTDPTVDVERAPQLTQLYRNDTIEVTIPDRLDLMPPATHVDPPGTATPVSPIQTPRPIVRPTRVVVPIERPRIGHDDASRIASVLTDDHAGDGFGEMHHRQPGADLSQQIEDARHKRITLGGDHTSRGDDRAHVVTDPTHPIGDDPTLTRVTPPHRDDAPDGRIVIGPIHTDDTTTLTPDLVVQKITDVYMAGLGRCYRKGLVGDAMLSGKVALAFTVGASGRVEDPEASGVSPSLDACVRGQMASWRFPIPHTKAGEPTDAAFKISLALRP